MDFLSIIVKKRNGLELNHNEIRYLVDGITNESIPDYQISAWAMAVFFRGMTPEETFALTQAMAESGQMADLSRIMGKCIDKHSTGGVGDKTTLVVAPIVAANGIPVVKMSGRGLGHTGGTIDKLESIPGFRVEMSREDLFDQINRINLAIISQSGNLVPADKKLYALRDVTGTVDSLPLIASSIMSKKIAAGAHGIVLDVKVGSGAFMKDLNAAEELANMMVRIGNNLGRETIAVISDNDQPLGNAVGNAIEVKEAILTLMGRGPHDLEELAIVLAAHMLVLGGKFENVAQAQARAKEAIYDGSALEKFKEFVRAQGGDLDWQDPNYGLRMAKTIVEVRAKQSGYIVENDAFAIGNCARLLGAGRLKMSDAIDHGVGVDVLVRRNQKIKEDDLIARVYASSEEQGIWASKELESICKIASTPNEDRPLILKVVE